MTAMLRARDALHSRMLGPDVDDWRTRAACRLGSGYDPELWWALPGTEHVNEAQRICIVHCPTRERCLQWANDHGETDGVWGGLTAEQRAERRPTSRRDRSDIVRMLAGKGWSDGKIARHLGTQPQTIARIRRYNHNPRRHHHPKGNLRMNPHTAIFTAVTFALAGLLAVAFAPADWAALRRLAEQWRARRRARDYYYHGYDLQAWFVQLRAVRPDRRIRTRAHHRLTGGRA